MVVTYSFRSLRLLQLILLVFLLGSCASLRHRRETVLFKTNSDQPDTVGLRSAVNQVMVTYRIRPNDYIDVQVYTNNGERLIDPNGELRFGSGGGGTTVSPRNTGGANSAGGGAGRTGSTTQSFSDYLVQPNGMVRLPLVNHVMVAGLTPQQADSLLQKSYEKYYKDVFVQTHITNNRVLVLGTPGGQILPLVNQNMSVVEVLASVGGSNSATTTGNTNGNSTSGGGRINNIRLIRPAPNGSLATAQVYSIDLGTIDGMRKSDIKVQPNDIIYIEPYRRSVFVEEIANIAPFISLIGVATSLVTTTFLVINAIKR